MNPLLPKEVKIKDLPNTSERDIQAFMDQKITLAYVYDYYNSRLDFDTDPNFPVQQLGCYLLCTDEGLNLNSWVYQVKPKVAIEVMKRMMSNIDLADPTKAIAKVLKVI